MKLLIIKAGIGLSLMVITGMGAYAVGHQTIHTSPTSFVVESTTTTVPPSTTTTAAPTTTTVARASSSQNAALNSRVAQLEGQVNHLDKTAVTEPEVRTAYAPHPVPAAPAPHITVPCNPKDPPPGGCPTN